MHPLPDRRTSPIYGYPSLNGYPSIDVSPSPQPPQPISGGYPLAYQGTPLYASPYQTYHNPQPAAGQRDFSSHSFGDKWYSSGKYGQWMDDEQDDESMKFSRLMFATVVTLLISLCMASLVIWLLFGVDVPDFQVASLSVSNLVITSHIIQASWTVNLTVTNPTTETKANGFSLKASILYKDYHLAMAAIQPTYTQALNHGLNQVDMFFKMENERALCKQDIAAEINEAGKAGTFLVSLRIAGASGVVTNNGWPQDTLRIFCEDLKVVMTAEGEGQLAADSPRGCLIFT